MKFCTIDCVGELRLVGYAMCQKWLESVGNSIQAYSTVDTDFLTGMHDCTCPAPAVAWIGNVWI